MPLVFFLLVSESFPLRQRWRLFGDTEPYDEAAQFYASNEVAVLPAEPATVTPPRSLLIATRESLTVIHIENADTVCEKTDSIKRTDSTIDKTRRYCSERWSVLRKKIEFS